MFRNFIRTKVKTLVVGFSFLLVAFPLKIFALELEVEHHQRGNLNSPRAMTCANFPPETLGNSYQIRNSMLPGGPNCDDFNNLVSEAITRPFFAFNLNAIEGNVTAATLRVWHPLNSYDSSHSSESAALYSVDANLNEIDNPAYELNSTLPWDSGIHAALFEDLNSGVEYGSYTATSASNSLPGETPNFEIISLNQNAITSINSGKESFDPIWLTSMALTSTGNTPGEPELSLLGLERIFRGADASGDDTPATFLDLEIDLSPLLETSSSAVSFDPQTINTNTAISFDISNTSSQNPMAIPSIQLLDANQSFTLDSNCGGSLAAGTSCSVTITFSPAVEGNFSTSIQIQGEMLGDLFTQSVSVQGSSNGSNGPVAPLLLEVTPNSLRFEETTIGDTQTKTITVSNVGPALSSPSLFVIFSSQLNGDAEGDFVVDQSQCPELKPGVSCSIDLHFSPSAGGNQNANLDLTLAYEAGTQTVSIPLVGSGPLTSSIGGLSTNTPTISFPQLEVGLSGDLPLVLENLADTQDLVITDVTITGDSANQFSITANCTEITANKQCEETISFLPMGDGAFNAVLTYNALWAGFEYELVVSLDGSSSGGTDIFSASPASLNFNNTLLTGTKSIGITYTNDATSLSVTVDPGYFSGLHAEEFTITNNCSVIEPQTTCSETVTLSPLLEGEKEALLQISHSSASADTLVELKGTTDIDGDNIEPEIEDGAANGGDGNRDGIPDSTQANVTSAPSLRRGYITIAGDPSIRFSAVSLQATYLPQNLPQGKLLFDPSLLIFEMKNLTPGISVSLSIYTPGDISSFWSYSSEADTWQDLSNRLVIGEVSVLTLTDGGEGDIDDEVNGEIKVSGSFTSKTGGYIQMPFVDTGYFFAGFDDNAGIEQSFRFQTDKPHFEHKSYFTSDERAGTKHLIRHPYFVFDLGEIELPVVEVSLNLWGWQPTQWNAFHGLYTSPDSSELITLHPVENFEPEQIINAPFNDKLNHDLDLPIFEDLGDGEVLASRLFTDDDDRAELVYPSPTADREITCGLTSSQCGLWLEFDLNTEGLEYFNNRSGLWALGMKLATGNPNTIERLLSGALVDLHPDKGIPESLTPAPRLLIAVGDIEKRDLGSTPDEDEEVADTVTGNSVELAPNGSGSGRIDFLMISLLCLLLLHPYFRTSTFALRGRQNHES